MHGRNGCKQKRKGWFTLGREGCNPNIKKYPLNWDTKTVVDLPTDVTYIQKGDNVVTVYFGEPDEVTSTMTRVPDSWKGAGKSIEFNALKDYD